MSFFDQLDILRKNLFRAILAVLIAAIAAFVYKDIIFDIIILGPQSPSFYTNKLMHCYSVKYDLPQLAINQDTISLINTKLAGQFKSHILISAVSGFIIAFPYVIFEIWRFIKPGLNKDERKNIRGFVFFTSLLFNIGVLFGYYIISPLTVNFLSTYILSNEVQNLIELNSYIGTVVMVSLSTGIVFQLPQLVYIFSKLKILSPKIMKKYRKHAIVLFFILSGILTPPDLFSQFLVALPLMLLYELSIYISKRARGSVDVVEEM